MRALLDNNPIFCKTEIGKSSSGNSDARSGIVPAMPLTFQDALRDALKREGAPSLKQVALGTGVSYQQLAKVVQGKSNTTNAEDALKVANFFGQSLDAFLQSNPGEYPHAVSLIYSRLPEHLRRELETYGQGLLAGYEAPPSEAASED